MRFTTEIAASLVMQDEPWESILPPLLAAAGIRTTGTAKVQPLSGGVSSDIVLVTIADGRQFCAKRALRKLRVRDDWRVPTERNHYEVAWFRHANNIVPNSAPGVVAEDRRRGVALLSYLAPDHYSLWKNGLMEGRADPQTACAVADTIGRIHRATLMDPAIAAEFQTDDLFEALRINPYLQTLTLRHPALLPEITDCIEATRTNKIALVHGDLSPKNILVAKADGHVVILDAECAWYGDPAFDAAFCLNHLVLKAIHMPEAAISRLAQAGQFFEVWLGHFPAEVRRSLEKRTAILLPCLMLARVDGKSPVDYLTTAEQQVVRGLAMPLIRHPMDTVAAVVDECATAISQGAA